MYILVTLLPTVSKMSVIVTLEFVLHTMPERHLSRKFSVETETSVGIKITTEDYLNSTKHQNFNLF